MFAALGRGNPGARFSLDERRVARRQRRGGREQHCKWPRRRPAAEPLVLPVKKKTNYAPLFPFYYSQSRSVIYNTTSVDTRHWPRTRRGQDGLRGQCQPDE